MPMARFVLLLVFFAAIVAPACLGQFPISNSPTATPIPGAGHDYIKGPAETVNPVNGSVSIRIPVIVPPGRGITLPFSFAYDSGGVNYLSTQQLTNSHLEWFTTGADNVIANNGFSQTGWSATVPMISDRLLSWKATDDSGRKTVPCKAAVGFVYQDAQGSRHNLGLTNYSDPGGTGFCTISSNDWPNGFNAEIVTQGGEGSILATLPSDWASALSGHVTVTHGDGSVGGSMGLTNRLWHVGGVADRYGNTITIGGTYPAFNYVDTAGRTVLQDSGFAVSPETLTVSGLGAPYTLTWTTLATPTFSTPTTILSGSNGCSVPPPHYPWNSTNDQAVSSITLPNGKSFTFTYDPVYGLVNKMTYPTGGYVRYVYGMNAQAEEGFSFLSNGQTGFICNMYYGVPAVFDRYVSFDGLNEVLHQHFDYTTTWDQTQPIYWDSKQTIVTAYDLVRNISFETVYKYHPVLDQYQPNMESGAQPQIPVEFSVDYYNDLGTTLLKTDSKSWQNERLLKTRKTVYPNGQTNETAWSYDTNEMQIEQDDYDFGTATPPNPPGPLIRKTVTTYATNATFSANHIVDKPSKVQVYDSSGTNLAAETDYTYDTPAGTTTSGIVDHLGGCNCGSLTTSSQWLNSTGTTLNTTYSNDDTGQRLSMTDPRGNTTSYSYADNYSSGSPPGPTNAYLTQVTHPQTNGFNHIEKYAYAYASGEVTSSTDQNNQVTTYNYNDPGNLARLTETDYPDGGKTTLAYNDSTYNASTPSPSVTTTRAITSSTNLTTLTAFDGLGHTVRSAITSDPDCTSGNGDRTDTTYDGLGRIYSVSNPYCTTGDPTYGLTTYTPDALGRITQVTNPDNSTILTTYADRATRVQDEGNGNGIGSQRVTRISQIDGLGRLASVCEVSSASLIGSGGAPGACVQDIPGTGFLTTYQYDALDNLLQVNQAGINPRSFSYDSLSRLTQAINPESGTTAYSYDANGNLLTKTDARNITTTYAYEALNRLTGKTYSDGTPAVTLTYDQTSALGVTLTNTIGRKSSESTAGSSPTGAVFSYDPMGRVVDNSQCTPQNCGTSVFAFQYTLYDFLGDLLSATNAAGVTFNYSYNTVARLTSMTTNYVDPSHPGTLFSNAHYTPFARLSSSTLGNTLNESLSYDNRLRLQSYAATSATTTPYSFNIATFAPNGDILAANDVVNSNWSYSYDPFNRLSTANTSGQSYSYVYDRFGNRWQQNGANSFVAIFTGNNPGNPQNNNRMDGYSYDAAGNLLNEGIGTHGYTYDAENRIIQVDGGSTAIYVYDAEGRRVRKTTASGTLDFLYDADGHKVAEIDQTGVFQRGELYASGRHLAVYTPDPGPNGATFFIHGDWLGTERARTDMTGTACETITSLPFGDAQTISDSCGDSNGDVSPMHFTGKERDSESGLDDFDARYYSSNMGRFMSPDWADSPEPVPYADLTNPQTLNLYGYVKNNPLRDTDPTGHSGDDSISSIIQDTILTAIGTWASDNLFGALRPNPDTLGGKMGQAIGDFSAQQSGIAESEAGAAGLASAPETAMVPEVGPEVAGLQAVVSEAAVLHGTATAAVGTINLAKDANQTSSGGPKANDAPGVTAGGQATDKQGNKLGPSRKPQINETNSNTREGAGNRALNEGPGKVEHPNPKRGQPHFHPTDKNGKKKPGSTHHNYPD